MASNLDRGEFENGTVFVTIALFFLLAGGTLYFYYYTVVRRIE